jgi:hypothetical protein
MSAVGAKPSDTAADGEPGVRATVWFVGVPRQSIVVYRWKTTVPVGFGTLAGVPALLATDTVSCTVVPVTTAVTAAPLESRMFVPTVASAQVFEASAPSPVFPSPVERLSAVPPTVTVVLARTFVVPAVDDLITTVHEPEPPEVAQPLGPTNAAVAPPEFVSVKLITVPSGAFAKVPEPASTFTCPVTVWFVEIGLFAVGGAIWMFASTGLGAGGDGGWTNVFVAGPELPCVESVVRETSAVDGLALGSLLTKCQTAVAFAVTTPGALLFTVNVHVAVFPTTTGALHVLDRAIAAAGIAVVRFGVIDVSVAVVPVGIAVVEMVNTCACPTSFVALGVMLTFASTNLFVAGPELPLAPLVERLTATPAIVIVALADTVFVPAEFRLIVTVHVATLPFTCRFAPKHVWLKELTLPLT